ncbi:undecaprenyl-diphosphatase [Marinobacter daqiaonensis]|uniref:Undecaprenyl-diphosphatase n=1 Tax=Marinobacter daqiaonensis TaxID=650891 RepID=A0A1I6J455_9GAMM|nr:bifunctional DedA family/phosphatase PAP2 family protein [Marinobacter daqiaonensis]SFR73773.1 undecaprenyl-diphosphatase [Marinobacter daqiaonensis]
MQEAIQPLTSWLSANPGWLTTAIFLTALLESLAVAGILIPGVAILFAFAVLAGKTGLPIPEMLAWAAAGAITGDLVSFWVGRQLRGRLHQVWPFRRHPALVRRAEKLFVYHGGKSVVIGRFVGPVRPVIPMVAGAFGMRSRTFVGFNIASAVIWAPFYLLPGYAVGSALKGPEPIPPGLYLLAAGATVALLMAYLLFFRIQLGLRSRSPLYRWLERRMASYNSTHHLWRRFSSDRPDSGGEFPLASISLALGGIGGFILWGILSQATTVVVPLDTYFHDLVEALRSPLTDPVAIALTLAGDPAVLTAGTLLMAAALLFRGFYSAAIHLIAALILTSLTVTLIKASLAVPRPELVSMPPGSYAFPSGHATGITVFLGVAAAFVARECPPARRWRIYLAFSAPMVLVAFSRVMLGVHWFSDVVGGVLLGLGLCGLIRASYSRRDRDPLSPDLATAVAVVLWLVFLAVYLWLQWPEASQAYSLMK